MELMQMLEIPARNLLAGQKLPKIQKYSSFSDEGNVFFIRFRGL